MINTSECEECIYSSVQEESKAKVMVYCSVKDRTYYYGQCVPCDNMRKQKVIEKGTENV